MTRKRRPKRFAQAFDHPVTGVVGGGQLGSLSGLFGLVVILMAGSKLGLVDQWGALVISGIVGGGIAGGVLGYFKLKQQAQATNVEAQLVILSAFALTLFLAGVNTAGAARLTCQRPEPVQIECELTAARWLGLVKVQEASLKGVQAARSEQASVGYFYLIVKTRTDELTFYNFSPELAVQLNHFVDSGEPELIVRDSYWPEALITGLIGGFLFLVTAFVLWQESLRPPASGQKLSAQVMGSLLIGTVAGAIALLLLLIGVYIPIGPSLICQRIESTQINCTLKEQWLSLITLSETPIKGLQAARIEGGPETVVLVADSGEVIFKNRSGSGDASGPIQDFITSTERDLSMGGGGLESLPFLFPFTLGMVLFLGLSYSNLKKFQREN